MRRALIADIHGNSVALEAVLRDCETQRVDEIVCLGDMIGFLPDVIPCVDLVRKCCAWSLAGDHEARLFMDESGYNSTVMNAIAEQRKALKPSWYSAPEKRARWKWLQTLLPKQTPAGATFVHGSPRDPVFEFVLPNDFSIDASEKTIGIFEHFEGLCFAAHTHIPGVACSPVDWQRPCEATMTFQLDGGKTFVNVGSVGQPRDGDPRSCYAIWDDAMGTVEFRRVEYDIAKLKQRFANRPEVNERYIQRLEVGR